MGRDAYALSNAFKIIFGYRRGVKNGEGLGSFIM